MKRFAKQCVLYLATVIIMIMTVLAIVAWHVFKWGYLLTRFFKTARPAAVCCRKSALSAEHEPNEGPQEEEASAMVSVGEKV